MCYPWIMAPARANRNVPVYYSQKASEILAPLPGGHIDISIPSSHNHEQSRDSLLELAPSHGQT